MKYQVSKNWDMTISFEELLKNNKDCYLDLNYPKCKFALHLRYPGQKRYSVVITAVEDGFLYIADADPVPEARKVSIENGLKLINKYRRLMVNREEFESMLRKVKVDEDCVNFVYGYNYAVEKKSDNTLHFIKK